MPSQKSDVTFAERLEGSKGSLYDYAGSEKLKVQVKHMKYYYFQQ